SPAAFRALLGVRLRPSRLPRVRRKPRASAPLKVTRVGRASVQRSVDAGSWVDQHADLGAELGVHHRFHHFSDSGTGGGTSDTDFGDRKSTRLNSSHVKIWYAVFCVKKKRLQ